ncbi:MAG: GNAT family N-acetyltransferase [Dehalococcoidia bacterium]|jgi:GNAT superfamily N-acetyltransferase
MFIRRATTNDLDAIPAIVRQWPDELAFVRRLSLDRGLIERSLFVAEHDQQVIGFVLYHARRDGWNTIYDIATRKEFTGAGIGRALLYAVPAPIRLKTTTDNERANRFYAGAGMTMVRTEQGRKRALNVWEMKRLVVLCKGNNPTIPAISRAAGMAYGTRNDCKPHARIDMLDIHWNNYDWSDYMALVNDKHPTIAMCADYERPEQRRQLYQQIRDLKAAGAIRILACPKFAGAAAHIPSWVTLAISVDSEYAGFEPAPAELVGRKLHLLGGTPDDQMRCIDKYHQARVISVDGSSFTRWAEFGDVWADGRKATPKWEGDYWQRVKQSAINIQRRISQYEPLVVEDMPLFAVAR